MIRKILAHRFLGIALLAVIVFAITVSPQNAYALSGCAGGACTYEQLIRPGFLSDLLVNLNGNQKALDAKKLTAEAAAPVQREIDNARTLVKQAIATQPATEEDVETPAWVALGNQAVQAAEKVPETLILLKARGTTVQGTELARLKALCAKNDASCDKNMRDRIASLEGKIDRSVAIATGGPLPSACNSIIGFLSDPLGCVMQFVGVLIGSILVSLSAWLLALADLLFKWTLDNTVLLFSISIFDKVSPGVNAGWTAMRDIANIVIIGMFTFLAISTILSIEEYGAKKLLARVLIIAVVINFSLLFTKMIIDASNFTAGQFYASASGVPLSTARGDATKRNAGIVPVPATAGAVDTGTSFRNVGFSGAFLNFMKVTSVSDTYTRLYAAAQNQGGWSALAHGILSAAVLLGAAIVLFYGSYLLLLRAVLFIFLMITAAGAFATHLIPGMTDSTYGWKGWWSSLLHNAALAPIMMVLLWITVTVSSTMAAVNGGTLGGLASTKPPGSADVAALFSYFIILGLLFGSFKLASKWAGKTGGLSFTGTMLKTAAVGTAAIASRFVAAPILRQTVGRFATGRSMKLADDIKAKMMDVDEVKKQHGEKSDEYAKAQKELRAMQRRKKALDIGAKGSYNLGNLGIAKAGVGMLKVPGIVAGQVAQKRPRGFQGAADERAKKLTEEGEKIVLKQRDVEDKLMADRQAGKGIKGAAYKADMDRLRAEESAARQAFETAETNRSSKMPQLERGLATAEAEKRVKDAALEAAHQAALQQQPYATLNDQHVTAQATVADEERTRATIVNDSEARIRTLKTIIANNEDEPDNQEVQDAKAAIATENRTKASALVAQDEKIRNARTEAERIKAEMANLDPAVRSASDEAETAGKEVNRLQTEITALDTAHANARQAVVDKIADIERLDNKLAADVRREAQSVVASSSQVAIEYVQRKAHRRATNFISWGVLGEEPGDDAISEVARRMAKQSIRQLGLREQLRALNSLQSEVGGGVVSAGGGPATPPPAPTAPTS